MATEFQIIERFLKPFVRRGQGVIVGPGDDCAVLKPRSGHELCVTTDAIVENIHFTFEKFTDADIGHKALAVNLSDIAAMGAVPSWFVCSVACRPEDVTRLPGIAAGMAQLASRAGIVLVGGNMTRAAQLSIHITAAGEVPHGEALTRSKARPGDQIYVTGTLGDAALAIAMRQIGRVHEATFARQVRPTPKLKAGALARKFAHSAIDVSDGLLQDLLHVCEASKVGASIDARLVPVSRTFFDMNANLDLALTGGEDYELALFVPPKQAAAFEKAMSRAGEKVTLIGEALAKKKITVKNAPHLRTWGHDHFDRVTLTGSRSVRLRQTRTS